MGWEREGGPEEQKQREIYGYEFFPLTPSLPAFSIWRIFLFHRRNFFLKRGKLGVFRIGISNSGKLLFFQREGKRCFAPKSPPSVPFHPPLHLNAHSGIHEKCCTNSSHGFFSLLEFSSLSSLFRDRKNG